MEMLQSSQIREREQYEIEIKKLRTSLHGQKDQNGLLIESLQQIKDVLSGNIPEVTYLRLKEIPRADLLPNEIVLMELWQALSPFRQSLENSRREIVSLREEIKILNEKQNLQLNELEHFNHLLIDKDEDYKRFSMNIEGSKRSLEMELQRAYDELALNREQIAKYDQMERTLKKFEQEKYLLEEKLSYYDANATSNSQTEIYRRREEMQRKIDLLSSDKEYLVKENIGLLEKSKRLEEKLDKLENELSDVKGQNQDYLYQLLNQRNNFSTDYEAKISKEISHLREKHNEELAMSKENLIEIYEKQIRFMREGKEELSMRLERAEGLLKEKSNTYDSLLLEKSDLQRRVENDFTEIRIQLRLKVEELERANCIQEETLSSLKANRLENEMLREKVNILKSEFYKMECSSKEGQIEIKSQLAVAREKLSNYETMENEIDQAISGLSSGQLAGDNLYGQILMGAPTAGKRRIQQSLELAKRLQEKQRECENFRAKANELAIVLERKEKEIEFSKSLVSKSNQYEYLISSIEEREGEISKLRNALRMSDEEIFSLKSELDKLANMYSHSQSELSRLLIKREKIQNIQALLMELMNSKNENLNKNSTNVMNAIQNSLKDLKIEPLSFQGDYSEPMQTSKKAPKEYNSPPKWAQKLKGNKPTYSGFGR